MGGIIRFDPNTGQQKIKIYTDEEGNQKGDARICYENEESIALAIDLLDNKEIRPGFPVHIEQATFEQKGDYKPRETKKTDKIIQA